MSENLRTYEIEQPWVLYEYLTTDRRTRITGRSKIACVCCICGDRTVVKLRIPRVGKILEPESGRHPAREEYLADHAHPGLRDPRDWKLPLANPAAWVEGIPLSVFENVVETARMDPELEE